MKLTFRETGIRPEVKRRILLLVCVFFAALIVFFFILNFKVAEPVGKMDPPSLPVITLEAHDRTLAPVYGYVRSMDAAYMYDSVVPIGEDRVLPVNIVTYKNKIKGLSIELRSLDTSRKIAVTEVPDLSEKDGRIHADAQLANLMEVGQEYLLVFNLNCKDREIKYYSRVTIPEDDHTDSCMDFSLDFSEKARAGKKQEITTYLEPEDDVNADTLSVVNIHSTPEQVCWKGFDGELATEPVMEIKDISPSYCVTKLTYYMKRDKNYYYVQESFRVRYGDQRMYLLGYDRTMDQITSTKNTKFSNNKLELGALSSDPALMSNETGTICAFSNMGSLFEFNENRHLITNVFSFVDQDFKDVRSLNYNHGIRILNIDESGSMDFVVYGYMNAGPHEGECGIDIYQYNSSSNVAKEIAFISTTSPYQILNSGISDLLYRSQSGKIYIMVEGTLFCIDAVGDKTSEIMDSLSDTQYAVSKSGRYIAWMDKDRPSKVIHVMDLSDESVNDIEAQGKDMIRPIAFMMDDLVYGCVRKKDLTKDAEEKNIVPMHRICIADVSGEFGQIIKDYDKKGIYVTEAVQESYALFLTRMKKRSDRYISTESDTIMASAGEVNQKVTLVKSKSKKVGECSYLLMTPRASDEEESFSTSGKNSKLVLRADSQAVEINAKGTQMKYYVYVTGTIVYSGADLKKAITKADDESGVVVDSQQNYVWRDGRSLYKLSSPNMEITSFKQEKASGLLDLTGATLSQVLYYVYLGEPTYGLMSGEVVTLVAYNSNSVTIYHPSTEKSETVPYNEAEKKFKDAGNKFMVRHGQE